MQSISYHLEPSQYLAGWREKSGTLFLPTLSESRLGDDVAVRVGIHGHAIGATLFGKVSLVRRVGRPALPTGVEIHLEKHSLAAARFLAMAARGEAIAFKERAPRWTIQRTIHVGHGATSEASTVNVSDSGCAVVWRGELPRVGDEISIRLKEGLFSPSLPAIVCWTQPAGDRGRTVGLKVVARGWGGRAWRALVASAARSGKSPT